jgi:acid phosphatase
MTEESLLPNTFSCKRLKDLDRQFARAAALAWNDTLRPLDKKLSKYIDGKPVRIVRPPSRFAWAWLGVPLEARR